jgi:hypothetical protein
MCIVIQNCIVCGTCLHKMIESQIFQREYDTVDSIPSPQVVHLQAQGI